MITFIRGRYRGRAIMLQEPVLGVVGIVECAEVGCVAQFVLTEAEGHYDPTKFAEAVDTFMVEHVCGASP